jgi:hypothetical protein
MDFKVLFREVFVRKVLPVEVGPHGVRQIAVVVAVWV